jgi:FkbM family methyltransferase
MNWYQKIKSWARQFFIQSSIDLTPNIKNDRLTYQILKNELKNGDNCIDIGAHKGEILDLFLKFAPKGKHIAIEPIPHLYQHLVQKYAQKSTIYPYAISDQPGHATFNHVVNAEAYSGLRERDYRVNPLIDLIPVYVKTLDELVFGKVDMIKIDVEGAELNVLKGANRILSQWHPTLIFEFGKGASEYYDATPQDLSQLLIEIQGYNIFELDSFINGRSPLTKEEFEQCYNLNTSYYFIAKYVSA